MPFVTHRGQRIHYEVRGAGPTVVLLHALFSTADRWEKNGWAPALARDFRVVTVDSLGHGESDKPHDPALYGRAQRAGDVIAVLDALGQERAHVVGYSMGGWLATAVAVHHPERLASLTLGGWDPADGVKLAKNDREGFDVVLAGLRTHLPELAWWITPEVEPALYACYRAIFEIDGGEGALARLACPVLLWSGTEDDYHDRMRRLADAHRFAFLSARGDHGSAVVLERERIIARLAEHFRTAEPRPPAT